jgi:hypothetical protein
VHDGIRDGAKILAGGKHVGERGYFYEPTVLLNTTPAMFRVSQNGRKSLFLPQPRLSAVFTPLGPRADAKI